MVLSDTLEGRKYIKKRLKAFYKIRSGVSHRKKGGARNRFVVSSN